MVGPVINGDVLVVGDVMRDIIVKPQGPAVHGSDTPATIKTLPGGSGANQAVWLAAHKVPVRFLARVGAADLAAQTEQFRQAGVTPNLIGDADLQTGQLVTLIDPQGERSFFTDRGANEALASKDCDESLLDGVGLLHISGYSFFSPKPHTAAIHLMELAKARHIPISVDPASIGFLQTVTPSKFLEWTSGVDFCFPNADEAQLLAQMPDAQSQIKALGANYGLVVLKQGAEGVLAGDRNGVLDKYSPESAKAVDSTGAGDAFFAGFVAAWRNKDGLSASLAAGAAAGRDAVSRLGGRPR